MIVEIMKSEVGRPTEDSVVRQNLKHYKRELRFKKKLSEVFEFWRGIVVKKAEGHSKAVSMGRKYFIGKLTGFEKRQISPPDLIDDRMFVLFETKSEIKIIPLIRIQ